MVDEPREVRFQDLIDEGVLHVNDGYRAKHSELGTGGPIFLRSVHLQDGGFNFDGVQYFQDDARERVTAKMAMPGDTVVTTKGNSTGRTGYVSESMPPFVYSPHLSFWRSLDHSKLKPLFLRYWARGPEFRDQLNGLKESTDMAPYLSLTDQRRLRITLPCSRTQGAIGNLLAALDDKIEANRALNETLEATYQALFRSWFVDFGPVVAKSEGRRPEHLADDIAALFPDRLEGSPIGPVPAGWRPGCVGDIADNPRRKADPADLAPSTPYMGLEHLPRRSIILDAWGEASAVKSAKWGFRTGEVLFGKLRPYFHKVGVALCDGICSTDILVVEPKKEHNFGLLLGTLSSREFVDYADGTAGGTRQPRTSWRDMARYSVAIPPESILERFTGLARQTQSYFQAHADQARTLTGLRDALLPRLLSSELRVRDAERLVEEAV